jgi:hypothetical protein
MICGAVTRRLWLVPALAWGALLVDRGAARACSFPPCAFSYAAPADNSVIPANSPGLVYVPGFRPRVGLFTLEDSKAVPFEYVAEDPQRSIYVLRPKAPLSPGWYRLVDFSDCMPLQPGPQHFFDQSFYVSESVDLPTSIGSIEAQPPVVMQVGSICLSTLQPASVALLKLLLSREANAFLPVARFTLTIDDEPWHTTKYGAGPDELRPRGQSERLYDRIVTAPFAPCRQFAGDRALRPGKHRGKLGMHIAGAAADPPPLEFDFQLDGCPATPPAPPWVEEIGRPPVGSMPDGGARVDAGPTESSSRRPEASARGGCSVGGSESAGPLVLLALLLLRRRR